MDPDGSCWILMDPVDPVGPGKGYQIAQQIDWNVRKSIGTYFNLLNTSESTIIHQKLISFTAIFKQCKNMDPTGLGVYS